MNNFPIKATPNKSYFTPKYLKVGEVANKGTIPKLVYTRVNVRNGDANVKGTGLNYALGKHGGVNKPNKSQFSISRDELKKLLQSKQVVNSPVTVSPTLGNFVRQVDVGYKVIYQLTGVVRRRVR